MLFAFWVHIVGDNILRLSEKMEISCT